ncbi:MAG: ABC transporter permease [Actinobacteria bacterium]|nr:ABC transporter permease [Actinomycetota bacterium]
MNIKRTFAISKKEIIHIRRDMRSLLFSFLIPLVLLVLFGYALSLDIKNIPTTILDYDRSSYSREFISTIEQSKYLIINDYAGSYKELEQNIEAGSSVMAIVIPPDFGNRVKSGLNVSIQTIIDGSNSNKAALSFGYISALSQSFSTKILNEEKTLTNIKVPLNTKTRVWYNENLESKNFIIPGLIAIIMLIIASLLTSLIISREWENGTMEQLIVSPVRPIELIVGKLIPYFLIGMFDLIVIVIIGKSVFNIYLRGSVIMLVLLSSIFLIGALGMGITISIITKSQILSYQLAMLTSFLPSYILSGLVFPISSMPKFIQYVSYIIPAKYFIIILRGIFLKGNTFMILSMEVLYLAIFAILVFIAANFNFVKKLN